MPPTLIAAQSLQLAQLDTDVLRSSPLNVAYDNNHNIHPWRLSAFVLDVLAALQTALVVLMGQSSSHAHLSREADTWCSLPDFGRCEMHTGLLLRMHFKIAERKDHVRAYFNAK